MQVTLSRAHDEREEQRSFALLRNALNEANRAAFDAMPIEEKRWLVDEAFKDGMLVYDAPYARAIGRPLPPVR